MKYKYLFIASLIAFVLFGGYQESHAYIFNPGSSSSSGASSSTISINNISSSTFTLASTSPIGLTVGGTTFTFSCATCLTTSTGLTTANFASANISQWTNNSGYLTSSTQSINVASNSILYASSSGSILGLAPITFFSPTCQFANTTLGPGATTTLSYWGPINLPQFVTAKKVGWQVTTADPSGQVDFGMYTNTSNGSVGNLVWNTGTGMATTTGFRYSNFTQGQMTIPPGSYWLALGTGSSTVLRLDACAAIAELAQGAAGSNVVNASGTLPATSTFATITQNTGVIPGFSLSQ